MKQKIMKYLTAPSQLASKLDWKRTGSVLAIDIGNDKIGLAIASHPSFREAPKKLRPLELKYTKDGFQHHVPKEVIKEFQDLVNKHNVSAFVISWPVQKEGRCGAPCGKALHFLDTLVEDTNAVINSKRPFCLWDDHHYKPDEDQWGRAAKYSVPSEKTIHKASEEQYVHKCSSAVAVDVWNDFCAKHWPEIHQGHEDEDDIITPGESLYYDDKEVSAEDLESSEDSAGYRNMALL